MTKTEALQFLELPESATESEIKVRLEERLAYYEDLSEHSPSDFLRRLHSRNIEKVRAIIEESKTWPAPAPQRPLGIFVDEEIVQDAPVDNFFTRFVTGIFTVKKKETTSDQEPVGWLIRHTENQEATALPLLAGKNYIGRKAGKFKPFLALEDDPHASKVHAVIYADPGEIYLFYVADNAESNEGKASTNGTYVNGEEQRISDKVVIRENDTIQVGLTKFVLRYAESDPGTLITEVAQRPYVRTVMLGSV